MSEEKILYDSSKSEIAHDKKELCKKVRRRYIIYNLLIPMPLLTVLIIFFFPMAMGYQEGVFKHIYFFLFISAICFVYIVWFLLIYKYYIKFSRPLKQEIIIGKDFIEVSEFKSLFSDEKTRIPIRHIDKLELDFNWLDIKYTKEGKKELGWDGIYVDFSNSCADRNFWQALTQTGKIELTEKDIKDKISKPYIIH